MNTDTAMIAAALQDYARRLEASAFYCENRPDAASAKRCRALAAQFMPHSGDGKAATSDLRLVREV